jgi:nicotinamidase-related amidase
LSAESLPYGPLGPDTVHLCIDMQTLFAERTDWHVPWMERVLPRVVKVAEAHPDRNIFTRFVPPEKPDEMPGTWRRYYERWQNMTGSKLDPSLVELVPPLAALVPPGTIVDKRHYSPFVEPRLHAMLQDRGINTLVITGSETDVCVLATVMAAVDLGYRVVIVRDGVCSASDETHDALMRMYHARFGQQIEAADVETVLSAWR